MNIQRIIACLLLLCAGLVSAQQGVSTSGSITTQNLVSAGTCTSGGCVELDITNKGTVVVQVTGTYTGALSLQRTADGSTWETLSSASTFTNVAGTGTATIGSGTTGTFSITSAVAGFRKIRVTGLAAVTGTATVTIQTSISGGSSGGSSGGGGASTIADGADVALGTTTDSAAAADTSTATLIALTKRNNQNLTTINTSINTANTQMPASLGSKASASSFSTTGATEDMAPLTPATATATRGVAAVATYVAAGVTFANNQQGSLQVDSTGALRTLDYGLVNRFDTLANTATATLRLPTTDPDSLNGSASCSAACNGTVLFSSKWTGYQSVDVRVTSAGTGATLAYQFSSDSTNGTDGTWDSDVCFNPTAGTTTIASITTTTTAVPTSCARHGLWFRVSFSAYTSGTTTAYYTFQKNPVSSPSMTSSSFSGQQAEDSASANGATGLFTLGIRRDNLAVSTSADADFGEFATNKWGATLTANFQSHAKTYSSTVNVAAAASATDIATICGQATTPAAVTRVGVSGVQTTAGQVDVSIIKRSTADSGGTSGAGTAIPHDSGDAAANSAVLGYTANPTTGTALGTLRRANVPVGGATSLTSAVSEFLFGDRGKPVFLKTTSECLAVNLNGATVTGGTFDVTFEWIELP